MSVDQIPFDSATQLIRDHGTNFRRPGVVGLGVADRNDGIRFIVAVRDEPTRQALAREFVDADVEGLPVHVEIAEFAHTDAAENEPLDAPRPQPSRGLARALLDRPGILVVAILAAAGSGLLLVTL